MTAMAKVFRPPDRDGWYYQIDMAEPVGPFPTEREARTAIGRESDKHQLNELLARMPVDDIVQIMRDTFEDHRDQLSVIRDGLD